MSDDEMPEVPKVWGVKFWIGLLVILLLGGALAYGGRRLYKIYRPAYLVRQAVELQAKGDSHNATLVALRVLKMAPNNVPATRAIAQMADKDGSYEALFWWRRVQELEPSRADALGWVASALRWGEYSLAQKALESVPENQRQCAEYEAAAASIFFAINLLEEAERHYSAALKFEPDNPLRKLDLALVQLRSKDAKLAAKARETLIGLESNPECRLRVKRELLRDYTAHHQFELAAEHSKGLEEEKEVLFSDRILLLELLWSTADPKWRPYFESLKVKAWNNPGDVGQLISWINGKALPSMAIQWAQRLKPETIHGPAAGIPLVESYLLARQWNGLVELAEDSHWGSYEYLRRVYLAKALRELGDQDGFLAQWNSALSAASKRRDALLRLAAIISAWHWDEPLMTLLWNVASSPSNQDWALTQLYRHYSEAKETRGLYQVACRMMEIKPEDEKVRNNAAMLGLLIKSNISRAYRISGELYLKHPTDPVVVSTYAYALHLRGQTQDALKVIEKLSPAELDQPDVAAYYGTLLASSGQMDKAEKQFARVKPANLLPEEAEMIERARHPKEN